MVGARYSSGVGTPSSRTLSFSDRYRLDKSREIFPSARVLASMLDRLSFNSLDQALGPLSQYLKEHPRAGLECALSQLNPSQRLALINQIGENYLEQLATRLTGFSRWSQGLFSQAGMLAGIYLGRRAEESLHFRPPQGEGDRWIDSLMMLVQFNAAGR